MMFQFSIFAAIAVLLALGNPATLRARLSAAPSDSPTIHAELTGTGSATAVLDGSKLVVTGSFEGLKTPATGATLNDAVTAGVRGPVTYELMIDKATSGAIAGRVDLSPSQINDFHHGGLYIEIHSQKAPNGALLGWLVQ